MQASQLLKWAEREAAGKGNKYTPEKLQKMLKKKKIKVLKVDGNLRGNHDWRRGVMKNFRLNKGNL